MSWYLSRRSQSDMAASLCLGPLADLDERLDRLGRNLGIDGLARRIVAGAGCAHLRNASAGSGAGRG
jgi:hypothetical protein